MAQIIGDYTGTTFDDFMVLPGRPKDKNLTPELVSLYSEICGVKLDAPFFPAAMRSVTGKELALAAAKDGIMPVVPRGLTPKNEAEIVQHVKDSEVKPGELEFLEEPVTIYIDETLGSAISKTMKYGHKNIPVVTKYRQFVGMFTYTPKHDLKDMNTPISNLMVPFKDYGDNKVPVCYEGMSDREIKEFLEENSLRFVPVIEKVWNNRKEYHLLSKLMFIQNREAYKIGAAIDTQKNWERRAGMLVEAGADMIFTDTSDAHKDFTGDVVKKYKKMFPKGPPICAGNIATREGFKYLADAGADAVKIGMGPGSICTTNEVLGIGAPPFWALVEVAREKESYMAKNGRYVPTIVDGGLETTADVTVGHTHADGFMGGSMFGCFEEAAGKTIIRGGIKVGKEIYGEASKQAFETTGNMDRYATPLDNDSIAPFQGVSGYIPYKGKFKPGLEIYKRTLKEALYHAGCQNLGEYRDRARLIRLSPNAHRTKNPHGIQVIKD